MAKKPKKDDPEQSQRFVEAAKELGTGGTDVSFIRAIKKIADIKAVDQKRGGKKG